MSFACESDSQVEGVKKGHVGILFACESDSQVQGVNKGGGEGVLKFVELWLEPKKSWLFLW